PGHVADARTERLGDRDLAVGARTGHQEATRSMYSRVSGLTAMVSPGSMNAGAVIVTPLSRTTGLVSLDAVLPLTLGSACATVKTTRFGARIPTISSSWSITA